MTPLTRNWIAEDDSAVFKSASASIGERFLADEAIVVNELCDCADIGAEGTSEILATARTLAATMREHKVQGIDAFMAEYDLSSREGVVLMCLAEALLRIPDSETADRLIADQLRDADFEKHLGRAEDIFLNVSTWGLLLSGRIIKEKPVGDRALAEFLRDLLVRVGEPVIRSALRAAMRIMSEHFVMGETIEEGLDRAAGATEYRYSFDMLGEAALTSADADDYFEKYAHAIDAVGAACSNEAKAVTDAGVSVKLSALSPRFEPAHADALAKELVPRLRALALRAADGGIHLTIDAEEADRLEPTLRAFEVVYRLLAAEGSNPLGIAVQAYQKRAIAVVDWLAEIARETGAAIRVRLVKGAYWDTEIKLAQQRGLPSYPVFTHKRSTDVSYLACARALLAAAPNLSPQFATHNPHTAAWILHQGHGVDFEFQRLHGMGEALYTSLAGISSTPRPCRVYAPVGRYEDLLPYLVRRLLENGANTSFVNRFVHTEIDVETLIQDPILETRKANGASAQARIPLPGALFGDARQNSSGLNLADPLVLEALATDLRAAATRQWQAQPTTGAGLQPRQSTDPSDPNRTVGDVVEASEATIALALNAAVEQFAAWNATPVTDRADILTKAARLLEQARPDLIALCVMEAGRTVPDAAAEVREAVDFLRYYAAVARDVYGEPTELLGPTGERNVLRLTGRGAFLCISPWNFPIAIFTGQVAAALAAGNTVVAKPAEQAPLTAARIVRLLGDAGLPDGVLSFLPGSGPLVGDLLLPDPRLAGVAFTGSIETAKRIERTLAARDGPIATLVAETGGVNAMIVDSSALTEQVVRDVVMSAFNSAGQRCSALRLLCLQEDTADEVVERLIGRMRTLVIGDPALIATDVGPVIDADAMQMLNDYVAQNARHVLYRCPLDRRHDSGFFFPPTLLELESVGDLKREVFGPVLHVARYRRDEIDSLVDAVNDAGFGLTLGIQSRVEAFARRITQRCRIGNVYVNRDMIGAVVGVQPFGGLGLSGTGPKAGGPQYLLRFGAEQTITTNTAAIGGNRELLSMDA